MFQADKTSCDINEKLTDKTLKKDEIFDFIMNPNRDDSDLYLRWVAEEKSFDFWFIILSLTVRTLHVIAYIVP